MFGELLDLSLQNIQRTRWRVLMTAAGIAISVGALVLLVGLANGLQQAAESGIGSSLTLREIIVRPDYSLATQDDMPTLDGEALRDFAQIEGVEVVLPVVTLGGGALMQGDFVAYPAILGIEAAQLAVFDLQAASGALDWQFDTLLVGSQNVDLRFTHPDGSDETPPDTAWLRAELALTLDNGVGTRRLPLRAGAVLEPTGGELDQYLLLPRAQVEGLNDWLLGETADTYREVLIYTTDRRMTESVIEAIRERDYLTSGLGDYLRQINQFFNVLRFVLTCVGVLALLIAGFSIVNTMLMAVFERTAEIGIMKAVGAEPLTIFSLFCVEAGLIGMLGSGAGLGLAMLVQHIANAALAQAPSEPAIALLPLDLGQLQGGLFILDAQLLAVAFVMGTCLSVGAGLLPALRAATITPVNALSQNA